MTPHWGGGVLKICWEGRTPALGGLYKTLNRTLVEKAKCILFESGFDTLFSAEAVCTAGYIRIFLPTTILGGSTPEEEWSVSKPDLIHMKVFGCKAMVHVPKESFWVEPVYTAGYITNRLPTTILGNVPRKRNGQVQNQI